jgi:nitrous oxide reductase accessory protein NosL
MRFPASQLASVERSVVATVEFVEKRGGRLLGFFEIDGSVVIGIKQPHRAAWRGESPVRRQGSSQSQRGNLK